MAGLKVNQLPEEVDLTLEKSTISADSDGKARRTTFQAIRDLILGAVFWFKNDPDQIVTNQIIPNSNGRGYNFNATEPLSSIDANGLEQGDMVWVLLDKAGLKVSHNSTTTGTFAPLWLMSTANYTSSKREQFCFRLWNTSDGLLWVEVTNSSITGTVTPDDYTAELSLVQGLQVDSSTTISGFPNGYLSSVNIYGGVTVSINAAGNMLTVNGSGVITSLKLGTGETISFSTGETEQGAYIGIDQFKNVYPVSGALGIGYSLDGQFLEHKNGFIKIANGKYVFGTTGLEVF